MHLLDLEPNRGTLARALVEVSKLVALAVEDLERINAGDYRGLSAADVLADLGAFNPAAAARRNAAREQLLDLEEMERTNRQLREQRGLDDPIDCDDPDNLPDDDATGAR